jgi:hypothetical protein
LEIEQDDMRSGLRLYHRKIMEREETIVATHDGLPKSSPFQAAGAQFSEVVVVIDVEDSQ